MLGIEERVKDVLNLPDNQHFSLVCVRTAEAKYLLFDQGSSYPRYVVQFGPKDRLNFYFEILKELNDKIPGSVSCPIALERVNDEIYLLIISGLAGMPWFNLRSKINTNALWLDLQGRALTSLKQFQEAVLSTPTWCKKINPQEMLKEIVDQYVNSVATIRNDFQTVAAENIALLGDITYIDGYYQHGDFCINNLIVADDSIGIIDLENFGELTMPLHDEFLLMNSLVEKMPVRESRLIEELWNRVLSNGQYTHVIRNKHISAFYLHHLLWLSIGSFSNPLRLAKNRRYEMAINAFCESYAKGEPWHSTVIWNLP